MLSHCVKLDELAKVDQRYDSREKGLQKVFVETKFSFPRAEGTPELTTYGIA